MPGFDALVFRFVDSAEEALAAFQAGECQLVANQSGLIEFQADLMQGAVDGGLRIYQSENKAWEQLSFGIDSRDSSRTLLADPKLRQTIAGCIDREKISSNRLDVDQIVDDFFPPGQSMLDDLELTYSYQPAESGLVLKELGWIDTDGDRRLDTRTVDSDGDRRIDTETRYYYLKQLAVEKGNYTDPRGFNYAETDVDMDGVGDIFEEYTDIGWKTVNQSLLYRYEPSS